ncbi:hypothetical protein [Gemmatimonas sp.]
MNGRDGVSTPHSAVPRSPIQYATLVNSEIVQLIRKTVPTGAKRAEFVPRDDSAMTETAFTPFCAPESRKLRVDFRFEMTLR